MERTWMLEDEAAQLAFGARLGRRLPAAVYVYLRGPLGAGKTTLVRGVLRGLGHIGAVRSPTYTLLETYDLMGGEVCHLDLYRLGSLDELEDIGARELFDGCHRCFVEWPERGAGWLPPPDLDIRIDIAGVGRRLCMTAHGLVGEHILEALS